MRADLARLGDERAVPADVDPGPATVFRADRTWPELLAERLDLLEAHADDVRTADPHADPDALRSAAAAVARHASGDLPSRVRLEGNALTLPGLGLRVTSDASIEAMDPEAAEPGEAPSLGPSRTQALRERARARLVERPRELRALEALALALQEDVVLIGPARPGVGTRETPGAARGAGSRDRPVVDAGAGRVWWLHVAFPSGWDPGSMAGASFERLHAPVPEAGALRVAARALVQAMLHKGPFVRYVWGLAPDGSRSRHPRHARAMPGDHPLDATWLRVERQTTLPLPRSGAALFAIGVHATPLAAALASPERREAFVDAVASLTPAMRRYKGVPWDDDAVRAWCRSLA